MNAARKIIAKFGGQTVLAKLLGKRQGTVQYWAKTGRIPSKWHKPILMLAAERGINLLPRDFLYEPEVEITVQLADPIAQWQGILPLGEHDELPCYVLDDGRRVISRTGAASMLTNRKGGGNLEQYVQVQALRNYIPDDFQSRMIDFVLPGVANKTVRGLTAEDFLTICNTFVKARDNGDLTTARQHVIATKASMLLMACAKTGLIALIDEATGYQYDRAEDALQVKLRVFLEEEMRDWEKTFPDELWEEFGRLTRWEGPIHLRPKYWGKLVLDLIYEYLDPDVTEWLRKNAPSPRHGQNYHQWLTSQYGLKQLMQHIWMVVGIAKTCWSMRELKEKLAVQFGREPFQLIFWMPPPTRLKMTN